MKDGYQVRVWYSRKEEGRSDTSAIAEKAELMFLRRDPRAAATTCAGAKDLNRTLWIDRRNSQPLASRDTLQLDLILLLPPEAQLISILPQPSIPS